MDEWVCVIYLQDPEDYDRFEELLRQHGEHEAATYLAGWDYGMETDSDYEAMYGYDSEPAVGRGSTSVDVNVGGMDYVLVYDTAMSECSLWRKALS
jgi:hypothetical protein